MFQFDKSKCLGNIYYLVKERGLKIGDVEEQAGVSIGYLSRLNKEDNKSTPGIDFLMSVAQILNVSLEGLLTCDYSSLTPDERKIIDFITKLIDDSQSYSISWKKDSSAELNAVEQDFDGIYANHPLMRLVDTDDITEATAWFVSQFHPEWISTITECFQSDINNNMRLFLIATKYNIQSNLTVSGYEMYMQLKGRTAPICCAVSASDTEHLFYDLIESLFCSVKDATGHVHLDSDIRNAIGSYLDPLTAIWNDDEPPF